MKKDKIEKLSTEELTKKERSLKLATGILAGILIVLFIVTISRVINEKQINTMLVVPIALSTICFRNYAILKNIRAELSKRTSEIQS